MDAGHGGQDPGAIGINKTKEKDITLSISKQLENKLKKSKLFKVIMTRKKNNYISISKRTKIAKKNNVNALISIHTNSSKNSKMSGSSIWLLSKQRINSEIVHWSKKNINDIIKFKKNRQYFLKKNIDPYLKLALLDFKFNYVQKLGYMLAKNVIQELKNVNSLYQSHPKHANFGILKSPNFPSILIEIGFISNKLEEKKLNNKSYQKIIVNSIYCGIKKHFFNNSANKKSKNNLEIYY
ncbi:MAG: N-acetylmuramoyl-L-alanine amidase [Buchnera aphidicola (Melaphis rhois)]